MPSWSIRFQGALDDQQIQDILNYIVSIQNDGGVQFDQNVCINPKRQAAPAAHGAGPVIAAAMQPVAMRDLLRAPASSAGPFVKGGLTVVMGFILFIGSVYLLLAAVFGRGWATWSWPSRSSAG